MKLKLLNPELAVKHAQYIASHQEMYPNEMKITDVATWADEIMSTPYSVGMYLEETNTELIGWRIFRREAEDMLYVSDLSILPAYQGLGYSREVVKFSLKKPRWFKECIHSFLRETSYHVVADIDLITSAGYKIVLDRFHRQHYSRRFGLNEDAHELILAPIG